MLEKDAMEILMKFLDRKVREAEEEVTQRGMLSDDKAIPLILKTQFNHIAHLERMVDERFEQVNRRFEEIEAKVDRRFEQVDGRFKELEGRIDARFDRLQRHMLGGFAALGFLISALRFLHS